MSGSGVTLLTLAIVAVLLAGIDKSLASLESSEIGASARRAYVAGSKAQAAGDETAALESFREAHSLDRQNSEYSMQLISALTVTGRTSDAEPLLNEVLQRQPNDGQANLIAARLRLKQGNVSDAIAYYHRAIYGDWHGTADQHRSDVRLELIDVLAKSQRKQELLAELISLEAQPVASDLQQRVAELFMTADSPARAAAIYQELVRRDPGDITANEGLGNAELELGEYRAAHAAYERAFLHEPNNPSVREHLAILNTVTGLDPTLRQLTSAEKYRRSIRILDMTRQALSACGSDRDADLLRNAESRVAAPLPAHVTNEDAEEVLSLAQMLWRPASECAANTGVEMNPLALIMKKLES